MTAIENVRVLDGGWLQADWHDGQLRARFAQDGDGRLLLVALHLEPGTPINTTLLRAVPTVALEIVANYDARGELLDSLTRPGRHPAAAP